MGIVIDGLSSDFDVMKYWTPTKGKNLKEELNNMIYSGEFCLSHKKDGNWFAIIKGEDGTLISRPRNKNVQGEYASKIEWIPHIVKEFDKVPNGTILLGEIYLKNNEQSRAVTTILGCLKEKAVQRQEKNEKLTFYIFDCLAFNNKNISDYPLIERVETAKKIYNSYLKNNPYIEIATYITDPDEMLDYIASVLESGGEGVVVQRKDNSYEFGKRTAHHSLKVKKELDKEVDCFLTGNYKEATWEYKGVDVENWKFWFDLKNNQKKEGLFYEDFQSGAPIEPISKGAFFGWAGSVEIGVVKGEEVIPIGWISNVTEEVKRGIVEDNSSWARRVVTISAMSLEPDTKAFRHARIIEWRNSEDMNWKDCTYEKIFGEEK
jgi:hypothetical protein